MSQNLVVVESPAKARTIKKYLGSEFEVLASYGHVRDLVPKGGAVKPEADFEMKYEDIDRSEKHIAALAKAMKKSDALYLATDPDREGEAIAWHVLEVLRERGALADKPVHRVVFHEITKRAIQEAVAHTREVSMDLVNAQQARRALDYLVGFNLSPLLWKKIRRGLSAGRVQSPALRLIVEREEEIERFVKREYWTIEADLVESEVEFVARLTRHDGEKIEQFSIEDETRARAVHDALVERAGGRLAVIKVEKKQRKRNPAAPFTTSTLQQEAARKLGFTASRTMRIAQQLYEGINLDGDSIGLITYMRTDSVTLAGEAVEELRGYIRDSYGEANVPERPREYRTRARNAQEAHEAIRPTSVLREPKRVSGSLDKDQFRLYQLIWQRTVACQMVHATIDTVAVDFAPAAAGGSDRDLLRSTGSVVADPGFMRVYQESYDDKTGPEEDRRLPALAEGDSVPIKAIRPEQHFTEPPPRYTEASLIRTLEDHGIGRPSTYAAIISTLLSREYAELDRKRFHPSDVGRLVNSFLTDHFEKYVDYDFTARLEDDLDAISRGEREWKPVMHDFWEAFEKRVKDKDESVSRKDAAKARSLGVDPKSGREITVRMGRFGPYVQIGSAEDEDKPQFAGLRGEQRMNTVTLEEALELFKLPRDLGESEEGEPLSVNIGRFGPYVRYGKKFASLGEDDDPHTVTRERALEIVAEKKKADAEREIQVFDEAGIKVLRGRYGPYVTDGKKNAKIPKEREPAELTLDDCQSLLAAAPASRGKKRGKKRAAGGRA